MSTPARRLFTFARREVTRPRTKKEADYLDLVRRPLSGKWGRRWAGEEAVERLRRFFAARWESPVIPLTLAHRRHLEAVLSFQNNLQPRQLEGTVQPAFRQNQAGHRFGGFRCHHFALPLHARGLRHQREAGLFPVECASDERAGHRAAFFQIGPTHHRGIFQRGKRGAPGSGTCACTTACRAGWLALTVIR